MMEVQVIDGDIERAIKSFKTMVSRDGILKTFKLRAAFETNREKRERKAAVSMKRLNKGRARQES